MNNNNDIKKNNKVSNKSSKILYNKEDEQDEKENANPMNLSPVSATPPKHIAVIMDGNRRFGNKNYGNALQVSNIIFIIYIYLFNKL